MTEKETLQEHAKALSLDTDGTIAELKDRIAAHEAEHPEAKASPPATDDASPEDPPATPAHGDTDLAVDGKHPASIVEPLPTSEKAGPASVQSREIRPDEQDLPAGTSALQN